MLADIAVEFMFESLVFDIDRVEALVQTLQDETNGPRLTRWVRRIDIRSHDPYQVCQKIAHLHLPNLQMQCTFVSVLEPLPIIPSHHSLHTIAMDYVLLPSLPGSHPNIFQRVRALTIIINRLGQEERLPIDDLVCPNLSQLTIIAVSSTEDPVIDCISAISPTSHPNLTHLTFHLYAQRGEHIQPLISCITRIRVQLQHLTITEVNSTSPSLAAVDLRDILSLCPNITELVISAIKGIDSANASGYAHKKLQTLGLPLEYSNEINRSAYWRVISIFSQKDAFPMMEIIRITKGEDCEGLVGNMKDAEWLRPHAIRLLEAGIALEDGHGQDIRQVLRGDTHLQRLEA